MSDVPPAERPRPHSATHEHHDTGGGWLRPTVFGVNDGLVSNAALLAGLAGGHAGTSAMLLAGWAGLVAGAFSMAAGEFISVQSSNESTLAEVNLERRELSKNPELELAELTQLFISRGVDRKTAARTAEQLSADPEEALLVHTLTELGIDPRQLPSPYVAAGSSISSFAVGALIPLVPYLFGVTTFWISAILFVIGLFAVGAVTSRFTIRTWLYGGIRQILFGGAAALITYGVGQLFHAVG
jgi:VIT1/CCC1 family predicted Fe2+/Mn2+ transporter